MLDFKAKPKKEIMTYVRLDEDMDKKVMVIARKHNIPKSTVLRSLIEAGLTLTKQK